MRSSGIAFFSPDAGYTTQLIRTSSKEPEGLRLSHIFNEFNRVVKDKSIEMACMEGPSYHSVNKSFSMGAAYGIYKLVCAQQGIPLTIVPPTKIKKYATGKGHASKVDIIRSCTELFSSDNLSDDEADALACCSIAREIASDKVLNLPKTRAALEVIMSIKPSLLG